MCACMFSKLAFKGREFTCSVLWEPSENIADYFIKEPSNGVAVKQFNFLTSQGLSLFIFKMSKIILQ